MTVSIVYATEQGLGRLARDFYDNGLVGRVLIKHHGSRTNHYDWYPDRVSSLEELFYGAKTFLAFETPFYNEAVQYAKKHGIRTILMPMYECTTDAIANQFDHILNPSMLDQRVFPRGEFIPVPVTIRWRLRRKARIFVHNAGHGGLGGRNGTKELLDAMKYVKSPLTLIIRSQSNEWKSDDPRVKIVNGTVPFADLWRVGDVFIFPEKFNGLSLPLQEAFAAGMLVMATDRFPNDTYLPREPLIPVMTYIQEHLARPIDVAIIDPRDIAATMDAWYDRDIEQYSLLGQKFNKRFSWRRLKKEYARVLG